MKPFIVAAAVVCPSVALAGGSAWHAEVLSISESASGEHSIQLRTKEQFGPLPESCRVVNVRAAYDWHWWQRQRPMKEADHREAIEMLREASVSHQAVSFGEMGDGFSISKDPCVLVSRGLQKIEGAVYSFYKWP